MNNYNMTKWYKTILGIASALSIVIGIVLVLVVLFVDKDFNEIILFVGLILGLIFLVLYLIMEHIFNANIFKDRPTIKRIIKVSISLILVPLTLYSFKIIINPDRVTKRIIIYVLPENFHGEFTINYKTSENLSNAITFTDTTIVYKIPSSGIFNSSYPCFKQANWLFPHFYIENKNELKEIGYSIFQSVNSNSNLKVYDGSYEDSYFGSRNSESFILDTSSD